MDRFIESMVLKWHGWVLNALQELLEFFRQTNPTKNLLESRAVLSIIRWLTTSRTKNVFAFIKKNSVCAGALFHEADLKFGSFLSAAVLQ